MIIPYPDKITRVCLVDETGRILDKFNVKLDMHLQDDSRTLKIFMSQRPCSHVNKDPVKSIEGIGMMFRCADCTHRWVE